jgi:hypothetical protein
LFEVGVWWTTEVDEADDAGGTSPAQVTSEQDGYANQVVKGPPRNLTRSFPNLIVAVTGHESFRDTALTEVLCSGTPRNMQKPSRAPGGRETVRREELASVAEDNDDLTVSISSLIHTHTTYSVPSNSIAPQFTMPSVPHSPVIVTDSSDSPFQTRNSGRKA